jgi:hypothetical protein
MGINKISFIKMMIYYGHYHKYLHMKSFLSSRSVKVTLLLIVIVGVAAGDWYLIHRPRTSEDQKVTLEAVSGVSSAATLSSILQDHKIKDEEDGDIDGDGTSDRLLVVVSPIENEYRNLEPNSPEAQVIEDTMEDPSPEIVRKFVVVLNQKDGQKVFVNDKIIYCFICSGMGEDPYNGITIDTKNHLISASNAGGTTSRFWDKNVFAFDAAKNDFHLYQVEHGTFDTSDDYHLEHPEEYTITDNELPYLSFEKYNGMYSFASPDTFPTVCYVSKNPLPLYDEPTEQSQHLRATIKTGTIFSTFFSTKNFGYTSILEKKDLDKQKGPYTSGFIPNYLLLDAKNAALSPTNEADSPCNESYYSVINS